MKLDFTKMQALGNDFVVIDNRKKRLKNISRISKRIGDRRFGIGADQVLLLENSREADYRMRIFNPDGSEAEMCGNGIRCMAEYIWGRKFQSSKLKAQSSRLAIETLAGIIPLQKAGKLIRVDMGEPGFEPEKIPVKISKKAAPRVRNSSIVINYPLKIRRKTFKITCISMGNPHTVIAVKNVDLLPLQIYGPRIENHRLFPNRTNVEFIQVMDRGNIKMRVWERGAGETMACGTGASAACAASAMLGLTRRKVTVNLPGGALLIEWSTADNHVYMTGPAVKVFEGVIET